MEDCFRKFGRLQAIRKSTFNFGIEGRRGAARDQRRHGHKAAITSRELRALPELAVYDVRRIGRKSRNSGSAGLACVLSEGRNRDGGGQSQGRESFHGRCPSSVCVGF